MASVLASHGCYYCSTELMNVGRTWENLGFSSSILGQSPKLERKHHSSCMPISDRSSWFHAEMRNNESPSRLGTNGRAVKMVPASEVMKRKNLPSDRVEFFNGSKQIINGASIVKSDSGPSPMINKSLKAQESKQLPPAEELKVLPSDEGFSWANENYNSVQRSIDVWSFVISLRIRILLDNAKWAYLGNFSEEKQVCFICLCPSCIFLNFIVTVSLKVLISEKQTEKNCFMASRMCASAWSYLH